MHDPVEIAQRLLAFDTINPPGRERACAQYLAELLHGEGFEIRLVAMGDGRASLVARKGRPGPRGPMVFTGHIDVVPLGTREWSFDPFGGIVSGDKLYGRGASDMKGGVAAFVVAAIEQAARFGDRAEVALIITGGEETGCDGAAAIVAAGAQGKAGALVVAEPTANVPFAGHKGALWLRGVSRGITAHGSMPEAGDNAVYKAARATMRLSCFHFGASPHPMLGAPTLNVGTFRGGLNINSVPDRAEIEIDVRTVPGLDHARLREEIAAQVGDDMEVETTMDLPGVWTSPQQPWIERCAAITAGVTGERFEIGSAPYFTDASVLVPALGGAPALILGPGEPKQAHQTDEWCSVTRIRHATEIYRQLIEDWAEGAGSP